MKILLVCSSAEPGRDGVGDYCRTLARELQARGMFPVIFALRDKYLDCARVQIVHEKQAQGGGAVDVYRISDRVPLRKRMSVFNDFISEASLDGISLQYVPHGFDDRGIPLGFVQSMASTRGITFRHVMLHELWVTPNGSRDFAGHISRVLQQFCVKRLISRFAPHCTSTSITLYKERLARIGIQCDLLPLLENIDMRAHCDVVAPQVRQSGRLAIEVVYFGTLSPKVNWSEIMLALEALGRKAQRRVHLRFIGNLGDHGEDRVLEIRKVAGDIIDISMTGPISFYEVGRYLLGADLGVSRTDLAHIGKSGSTLAMLAAGLPVIPADSLPHGNLLVPIELQPFEQQLILERPLDEKMLAMRRSSARSLAPNVAERFLDLLGRDRQRDWLHDFSEVSDQIEE